MAFLEATENTWIWLWSCVKGTTMISVYLLIHYLIQYKWNTSDTMYIQYMCAHAMAVLVLWIHAYCYCIVFFSQITQEQVTAFQAEAKKFNEKFKMEGPASVRTDLDKGKRGSSWQLNQNQFGMEYPLQACSSVWCVKLLWQIRKNFVPQKLPDIRYVSFIKVA